MFIRQFVMPLVDSLFTLVYVILIVKIIMSWIPIPSNRFTEPVIRFVGDITEPILGLFRSVLPPIMVGDMGLDLSPMVAILVLYLLKSVVMMVLQSLPVF
ncbi:MAG: YggT family protein [Chloroflexi bacterium]|nr:YggT family protein [Chloroflexota bacterium]